MDIYTLTDLFGWMTAINLGMFILAALLCVFANNYIARVHGKMFGLPAETIKATLYGFLGIYKLLFIVFCLIPWIALKIVSKCM
ncbi:MAG: hypothetical protein GXY61_07370 [Lentisphaerae bacterium]|jgi:hypothetical protein|nr:hypothetical protein [Lentisphaerota bacterium]